MWQPTQPNTCDSRSPWAIGSLDAGWLRLSVASGADDFPGWWRRDGIFLLTVVAGSGLSDPPEVLAGSADLTRADAIHSWLAKPLADPLVSPAAKR